MRFHDALCGLFLAAFGAGMILLARDFPAFPGQPYGPALFPSLLGAGLVIAGALLTLRGVRAGGHAVTLDPGLRTGRGAMSVVGVLLAVGAQIAFADEVGFLPLCAASLLLLMLLFGERPARATLIALGATAAIWWFFAEMLRVPLPQGLLTGLL